MPSSTNLTASFTSHDKVSIHIQLGTGGKGHHSRPGHHSKSEYLAIWLGKDGMDGTGGMGFMSDIQAARKLSGHTLSDFNKVYDETLYQWKFCTHSHRVKIQLVLLRA